MDHTRDRHRPGYHFLPAANWMNDPNGLMQWQGTYHLFYQYNPNGAFWGTMHWGHARSRDLVHWEHLPIALAPDPDGPDADGVFSGCAVIDDGVPTLVYTGVRGEAQLPCLALPEDDALTRWRRYEGNPVIAAPPAGIETTIFRDHAVWRERDTWYQVIGSGIAGKGGAAMLYRSSDLRTWEFLHPFCVEEPWMADTARPTLGWECPDVFTLSDRMVMIACVWDGDPISVSWFSGDWSDEHFTPRIGGLVDGGSSFYAPQSFTDEQGRRVLFGWLREARSGRRQLEAGWSGVMSLPRVLSLDAEGRLQAAPAPEVEALRGAHAHLSGAAVRSGETLALPGIDGDAMELVLTGTWSAPVTIRLRRTPDGEEETVVSVDPATGRLSLDTRRSSVDPEVSGELASMPAGLADGEELRLRIFVDRSVVEVFLNERASITGRVYPTREDSLGVVIDGSVDGVEVDAWAMRDIWS